MDLRKVLTFAETGSTTFIRSLRNPQQNQCADKIYVTGICTRNSFTFWNMLKDLSLESRNIQTQNCAPIQCTVWPRKAGLLRPPKTPKPNLGRITVKKIMNSFVKNKKCGEYFYGDPAREVAS